MMAVSTDSAMMMRIIAGLHKALPKWQQLIKESFLSEEQKKRMKNL